MAAVVLPVMTYYDREADIVYFEVQNADAARSVEHVWGLIDVGGDGQVVGLEYWDASERLPEELLGALPAPKPPVEATAAS